VWLACAEDAEYLPPQVRAAHFPSRLPRPAAPTLAQSTPSSKEPGCLLFVGSLGYLPNIDAALFLAREVAPRLRRLHAGRWRILILGRGAPRSLVRRLRATPEIEVVGEVADLAPYYRRCQAALVPLRGGGGTKIKTIEAFANNCPVVSTAEGVRGLVVRPGLDYLQADDADAVAQACARLRACPALAQELTRNASELFARRYALEDGAAPRSCGPCSPPEYPGRAGEQTS
jgi:glycosyltransferase involved in cell wall biosynthesis